MPYLPKSFKRKEVKKDTKDTYQNYYNSRKWRSLRESKLKYNPLCEIHNYDGETAMATEVHHIQKISNGRNDAERKHLAYDYDNLMSICGACHTKLHKMIKTDAQRYYILMVKVTRPRYNGE